MKHLLLILPVMAFVFAGCLNRPPDKLVDEETYKRMFVEFAIINQYDSTLLKDHTHDELRELVYEYYGVSSEQFRVSHEYYESDLDAQIRRVGTINEMLRKERERISEAETEYRNSQRTPVDSLRQNLLNR
jgi:hypothetical protein